MHYATHYFTRRYRIPENPCGHRRQLASMGKHPRQQHILTLNQTGIEQLHVTSQVWHSTKMCGKNMWHLYRERRIFNYFVAIKRITAKPPWHNNCPSVVKLKY